MHLEETPLRRRRLLPLLLLLLLLAAYWLRDVPERPERIYRALPTNSVLISEHRRLAEVWHERLSHPFVEQLCLAAGVGSVAELAADTQTVRLVRLLSGPRVLIGWSPAVGPGEAPCWTGASHVGLRGRLFQVLLRARWIPGLGRLRTSATGVRYLTLKSKRQPGLKLAFAVHRNVLLATLGTDPEAVRVLLWRLRHDAAPAPLFGAGATPWRDAGRAAPHRAWLDPSAAPLAWPVAGPVELRLSALTATNLLLSLLLPPQPDLGLDPATEALHGRCTAADRAVDASARGVLLLSCPGAARLAGTLFSTLPLPPGAVTDAAGSEDVCLYVGGKPFGGRLFNLQVPSLSLLWPASGAASPGDSRAALTAWLERIDTAAQGALLIEPETTDAEEVSLRVNLARPGGRAGWLSAEECLAVVRRPEWLTLTSSVGSLKRQQQAPPQPDAAWRQVVASRDPGAQGLLWMHAPTFFHETKQILAVLRLAATFGLLRFTPGEEDLLRRLPEILNDLEMIESLRAELRGESGRLRLELNVAFTTPTAEAGARRGKE